MSYTNLSKPSDSFTNKEKPGATEIGFGFAKFDVATFDDPYPVNTYENKTKPSASYTNITKPS